MAASDIEYRSTNNIKKDSFGRLAEPLTHLRTRVMRLKQNWGRDKSHSAQKLLEAIHQTVYDAGAIYKSLTTNKQVEINDTMRHAFNELAEFFEHVEEYDGELKPYIEELRRASHKFQETWTLENIPESQLLSSEPPVSSMPSVETEDMVVSDSSSLPTEGITDDVIEKCFSLILQYLLRADIFDSRDFSNFIYFLTVPSFSSSKKVLKEVSFKGDSNLLIPNKNIAHLVARTAMFLDPKLLLLIFQKNYIPEEQFTELYDSKTIKEKIYQYISSLPNCAEKRKILDCFFDRNNSLGRLFMYTSSGVRRPNKNRGMLKKINELIKSLAMYSNTEDVTILEGDFLAANLAREYEALVNLSLKSIKELLNNFSFAGQKEELSISLAKVLSLLRHAPIDIAKKKIFFCSYRFKSLAHFDHRNNMTLGAMIAKYCYHDQRALRDVMELIAQFNDDAPNLSRLYSRDAECKSILDFLHNLPASNIIELLQELSNNRGIDLVKTLSSRDNLEKIKAKICDDIIANPAAHAEFLRICLKEKSPIKNLFEETQKPESIFSLWGSRNYLSELRQLQQQSTPTEQTGSSLLVREVIR